MRSFINPLVLILCGIGLYFLGGRILKNRMSADNKRSIPFSAPMELYNADGLSVGYLDSLYIFHPHRVYELPEN